MNTDTMKKNSGSNWNRCDLHVHTPKSVVQNFGGDTEEIWEKYIKDLEDLPEDFKIIGINDYLFVDGYEKVLEYKKLGRLSNIDLLLPVIEFRLSIFTGNSDLNKINYHIIFADQSQLELVEIKEYFLDRLIAKKEFTATDNWDKCIPSKEKLIEYGQFCKKQTPSDKVGNEGDLKYGFNNLTYDLDQIKKLLQSSNFQKNGKKLFFTAIGRSEWEKMRWNSAMADKKSIINGVDFVLTGSPSIEEYNRGMLSLSSNEVNSKLLHFSDAHYFSNAPKVASMRIGDSFTLMKCQPTFEGLRQIKHVFLERVRVSDKPIESKKPYYVIDSVKFNDNTGRNLFQPEPIFLNQNLNTIIGGKSTGKSLLLNHIAKSIDHNEVSTRLSSVIEYDHEKLVDFDFTVTWQDGEVDTLNSNRKTNRKIVYISQSYIDELTSNRFEERIKFNEFVLDILLQNDQANLIYNQFQQNVVDTLSKINSGIQRLFDVKNAIDQKLEDITEIGDLLGVSKYIKSITTEIQGLKSDGMTPEESDLYSQLMSKISLVRNEVDALKKDQDKIDSFSNIVITNLNEIKSEYESLLKGLSDERIIADVKTIIFNPSKIIDQASLSKKNVVKRIIEYIALATKNLNNLNSQLSPLSNKSKQVTLLKEKMKQLEEEQAKLVQITSENKLLDSLKQKKNDILSEIVNDYKNIESFYLKCSNDLKQFSGVSSELDISIQVRFNDSTFNNQIESNRANKPSLKRLFSSMINDDDVFEYRYDRATHIGNQKKFLTSIINETLKLNQYGNSRQLAKALFEDNFYLNFVISYQQDTLDAMSPGKKNLVVLKLLIELNNSEYPILIDQPEDDLDNRSIYDDLVQFILKKKGKRQIILVTHNPNVVVGTDSENTIVANQAGQVNERINNRYKFEYCNGAIENSFLNPLARGILFQKGIKEHICDILEGGEKAFKEREARYSFHK